MASAMESEPDHMGIWKNEMTTQQVTRKVLRSYLVRCHRLISEEYPEIANMAADRSADYLLHLQDTGRIDITLYNKSDGRIGCAITEMDEKTDGRPSDEGTSGLRPPPRDP